MSTRKTREPQLPPMAPLTVRFPVDDLEAMRRLAKENHRSLNSEIVHAVAEYIRQQETKHVDREDGEQETRDLI
jgi:hypothetical protein